MAKHTKLGILLLAVFLQLSLSSLAQQTLGGITGTVSDRSGSVLPDTTVTIVGDQTKLTRTLRPGGGDGDCIGPHGLARRGPETAGVAARCCQPAGAGAAAQGIAV